MGEYYSLIQLNIKYDMVQTASDRFLNFSTKISAQP